MRCDITRVTACLLSALSWCALAAGNFEEGLVGYYPFEGSGDVIEDASGENNHGEMLTALREADGKFGNAIRFDGNRDGAAVDNAGSLRIDDDDEGFTCSYWVYAEKLDFGGENRVVYSRRQFNLDLLTGAGRLEVRIGPLFWSAGMGPVLQTDEWHFVAATWSPDDGSVLYRDGVEVASNPGAIGEIDQMTDRLFLGGIAQFDLNGMVGRLDEVRLYDRPMDEDEVFELFEFEPGAQAVSPEGSLTSSWGVLKSRS